MSSLVVAVANHDRALRGEELAKKKKYEAMVRCVLAGNSRYAVAKIAKVTGQRVSQIPGMPKGRNATTADVV